MNTNRFQAINLPSHLSDPSDDTKIRKMGLDILQKLNTTYSELQPAQQINNGTVIVNLSGILFSPEIDDHRNTIGGTRTETVVSLNVGQTARIKWQLIRTSGTITLGLPSTGTYEIGVAIGIFSSAANTLTSAGSVGFIASGGAAPGGSTVSLFGTGTAASLEGYVRRVT